MSQQSEKETPPQSRFLRRLQDFYRIESETESPYFPHMSTKEIAMETIKGLPEDASWQEIEARIHLIAEVNLGSDQFLV